MGEEYIQVISEPSIWIIDILQANNKNIYK